MQDNEWDGDGLSGFRYWNSRRSQNRVTTSAVNPPFVITSKDWQRWMLFPQPFTVGSPRVKDLGNKWKIFYWDYSSGKRCAHTKSWAKSKFPSWAEAQPEADQFIEGVNDWNNQPQQFPFGEGTLAALVAMCRERIWPLLKNSTRLNYDFFLNTYLLPELGPMKLTKMRTLGLQDFFNSFSPRLAPKTIRNMHACLRTVLTQGKTWGIIRANRSGSSPASQEGTETSCVARKAGYSPSD